jgi:hypothetical protein
LRFRDLGTPSRKGSDVYVDPKGSIFWNGSERPDKMHKPGEVRS